MDLRILVTGDYWHRDFRQLLTGFEAVTLVQINKISTQPPDGFQLVVVAQSRRDQFTNEMLELVQQQFANIPVVALLGSWCEGESRSGSPWPGVLRIYWHQWQGRFASFIEQVSQHGVSSWHLPRTASTADRILAVSEPKLNRTVSCVGISAWTRPQFESLRDAFQQWGWNSRWIERCTWDAASAQILNPIVVDADSLASDLELRLDWLETEFPASRFVLLLNFPRVDDREQLSTRGISQVISKPYELNDLKAAIQLEVQSSVNPDGSTV